MAPTLRLLAALVILASVTRAQNLYCPAGGGGRTINWDPNASPALFVQTTSSAMPSYTPNMNCYFEITATIPGRIVVQVLQSSLHYYNAYISIRTSLFGETLAGWNQLSYYVDYDSNFVSKNEKLYIAFTTGSSPIGNAAGVQLKLTFLGPRQCLPNWRAFRMGGMNQCVGSPTLQGFKFGEAQRYCNRWRSNLLVSDKDDVSRYIVTYNAWIGMTAEPSGSSSWYRWINDVPVNRNQNVSCTGSCTPGSTRHRCVQAESPSRLAQISCDSVLQPICHMPEGGTDTFYKSSTALRASGAVVSTAIVLMWGLMR